jgi:hypothetical protein
MPGDRVKALTPDGLQVEVVMGGDSAAHIGEVYMLLLSRTIPVQGAADTTIFNSGGYGESAGGAGGASSPRDDNQSRPKAHYTQTVGEMQLLQEIENVKRAMGEDARNGNSGYDMKQQKQREAELAQLELLRARVQMQGLRSEMNILRKEQSQSESPGAQEVEGAERSMRERLRRMRLLEDDLRKLQEA